jgi:general secretion pathway protein D
MSCAGYREFEEGRQLVIEGNSTAALFKLEEAVKKDPNNANYRQEYLRVKNLVVGRLVSEGDLYRSSGELDKSEDSYRKADSVDPGNAGAKRGLAALVLLREQRVNVGIARAKFDAGELDAADAIVRKILDQNPGQREARELMSKISAKRAEIAAAAAAPSLKSPFSKPITLEFRDATLKSVFEVMSRTAGINFVFDRDVRSDTKINIFVRNSSLEDVVKLILVTNQLDRKLLNENSVLIYPNTPAKQKEYRELVVRTFYLANADVKQAVNLVKGMVKTQDVFIDEKLNLMVVKDTPEAMNVVEKLMRSFDLAEPEVMLELEVLEVSRTKLQQLGIQYPESISFGNPAASTGDTTTGAAPANVRLSGSLVAFTANPPLVLNILRTDTDAKILANPRIRVRNREKAKIHIGSRVPVVTTTSTANVGVSSSVSYLDVGLKLDVEPNIYLRDEVAIKVGLEVSTITRTLNIQGTVAYELGTRNTATTLQIKDGETQMLAGLIDDEDRRSANRVPGLSDIPVVGRLFSNQNDNVQKTEIVLLVTPRVVRNINWPQFAVSDTPVGTDTGIGNAPLRIQQTTAGSLALAPSQGVGGAPRALPPPGQPNIPGAQPGVPPGPGAAGPGQPGQAPGQPGAAAGAAQPEAQPAPGLLMAAPLAARTGNEVLVSIGLPPGTPAVSARLDLAYDPAMLEPVGAAVSEPGRLPLKVDGSVSVRFKVLGQQGGRAQVRAENVVGVDSNGAGTPVSPPNSIDIAITP